MKLVLAVVALCLSIGFTLPAVAEVDSAPQVSVSINDASAAEIAETLSGIGLAKAEAIVSYREENGTFESVEQLEMVKGIGSATIEKNRDRISLK